MKAVARADNPGLQEVMPDWVSAALPQRQADIMTEIGRLQAEIETLRGEAGGMESMARLLWQAGRRPECFTFLDGASVATPWLLDTDITEWRLDGRSGK